MSNPTYSSDPADPRVSVPAARYESVFASESQARPEETAPTPDKAWKSANATVAAVPAHAGHAMQAAAPAPKPASTPAADHSKHH